MKKDSSKTKGVAKKYAENNQPQGSELITFEDPELLYNSRHVSMNARTGINPTLFFDASKNFKLSVPQLEQILHISGKTIQNKIENNISLGPVHGEHLLKLRALYAKGVELFRTVDEFNHWLNKPFWFSNEKPMDWIVTPGGIDAVMDELIKMAYGDAI